MSTEREIVEKFKEGVETKNMNVILPYLTEDVTYELLPSTVGGKRTRAEWVGQMTGMLTVVQSFGMDITSVIEHPLFVVVQANVTFTLPLGPVSQEIILLIHFTKDASGSLKISSFVEYVDAIKMKEFEAKMAGGPTPY